MEWSSTSWGSGTMMLEQAKEELQILETQYPNQFGYLKQELKSFIFLLESQNLGANSISLSTSSSVITQESTAKKRRKISSELEGGVMEVEIEGPKQKKPRGDCDVYMNEKRDRVDLVIERAQACLHKIQRFKACFG
ncbi:uncharacterized protein LOC132267489 [Cornus florida]|uniref:uncharacterized protein LOC132267489 n=1 Tax=Cornus florida TaxID=4283 RepID=UPI00289CA594|nr:uncharacterized protein LOC132267489 [Cornus florida]